MSSRKNKKPWSESPYFWGYVFALLEFGLSLAVLFFRQWYVIWFDSGPYYWLTRLFGLKIVDTHMLVVGPVAYYLVGMLAGRLFITGIFEKPARIAGGVFCYALIRGFFIGLVLLGPRIKDFI